MTKINIQYATDELIAALHKNADFAARQLIEKPNSNTWLKDYTSDNLFTTKKYSIEDFELKIPNSPKDYDVIYEDAVILYEHLRELPGYVLSDERFWVWLTMEKFYRVAYAMTLFKGDGVSTFKHLWIFTQSNQRSLFFGVLSRLYFRVALSVDNGLQDPYEYTKFSFENQYRLREMTWRTYSSERYIVRGALKGIKDFLQTHDVKENNDSYTQLAKDISLLGSVKLLDAMPEEYIREQTFKSLKKYYNIK